MSLLLACNGTMEHGNWLKELAGSLRVGCYHEWKRSVGKPARVFCPTTVHVWSFINFSFIHIIINIQYYYYYTYYIIYLLKSIFSNRIFSIEQLLGLAVNRNASGDCLKEKTRASLKVRDCGIRDLSSRNIFLT